jgi:hypothetical protein
MDTTRSRAEQRQILADLLSEQRSIMLAVGSGRVDPAGHELEYQTRQLRIADLLGAGSISRPFQWPTLDRWYRASLTVLTTDFERRTLLNALTRQTLERM